jgi:predicted nuclease with RNAse H fold
MQIPMKPPKARQINVRVEDADLETKEILKSKGVDVAELYRRAIRAAHEKALEIVQAS